MSRPGINPADYAKARYLGLNSSPVTDQARALGNHLAHLLFPTPHSPRARGRPPRTEDRKHVLLQITADMLEASSRAQRLWVYHSLNVNAFGPERLSYRHFRSCMTVLVAFGMAEHSPGFHYREGVRFGEVGRNPRATASRWRPTDLLLETCARFGVTPDNIKTHFLWKLPAHPLVLKAPSARSGAYKLQGRQIRFEPTERTRLLERQVETINRNLAAHEISGGVHRAFRRVFNDCADPNTYGWNRGGRLYGTGEENYQLMPKAQRRLIRIDRKDTVEIDIKASHLTILHALAGVDLLGPDPYEVPGLPREVVKQWFLVLFGSGQYPSRWSKSASAELAKHSSGRDWKRIYPVRKVQEICKSHYRQALGYWEASGLDSLDFQFLESEAVINAMQVLKDAHGIPSLPVHDSLIVPVEAEKVAREVLSVSYMRKVGVTPLLS